MAYKREFGDAVRDAIAGRPYRTIAARGLELTGEDISAAYIADMVQGRIPRREKLESFVRGCGLGEAEASKLFSLAGLEVADRPRDYFWKRFGALAEWAEAREIEVGLPRFSGGAAEALESIEGARRVLRETVSELADDYPEHAEALRAWSESTLDTH